MFHFKLNNAKNHMCNFSAESDATITPILQCPAPFDMQINFFIASYHFSNNTIASSSLSRIKDSAAFVTAICKFRTRHDTIKEAIAHNFKIRISTT